MDETLKKKMLEDYDCPVMCKECEGVMVYKGLGEYKCENCGAVEYDEYGKVRNYLDEHRGAVISGVRCAERASAAAGCAANVRRSSIVRWRRMPE